MLAVVKLPNNQLIVTLNISNHREGDYRVGGSGPQHRLSEDPALPRMIVSSFSCGSHGISYDKNRIFISQLSLWSYTAI